MSSTTVPNPANGSFPSRSCRLSAGCGGGDGSVVDDVDGGDGDHNENNHKDDQGKEGKGGGGPERCESKMAE